MALLQGRAAGTHREVTALSVTRANVSNSDSGLGRRRSHTARIGNQQNDEALGPRDFGPNKIQAKAPHPRRGFATPAASASTRLSQLREHNILCSEATAEQLSLKNDVLLARVVFQRAERQ